MTCLRDVPPDVAMAAWREELADAGVALRTAAETVRVGDAWNRVTAAPVVARWSSPPFRAAAMDGYACRSDDIVDGRTRHFRRVDTGDAVPDDADMVAMIERCHLKYGHLVIEGETSDGQHIRLAGEDILAGEPLATTGQRLSPFDLAAIAAAGHATIDVRRRPRVTVIPTGDEIRAPGEALRPGEVTETNGLMLAAQARAEGGEATVAAVVRDDPAALRHAVEHAAAHAELVLLIAGSSRGRDDHTASVLAASGRVVVEGVAVRPGHPVILARVGDAAVIGVPGYPLSAAFTFRIFALPFLEQLLGTSRPTERTIPVRLDDDVRSRVGATAFVPLQLRRGHDGLVAIPIARKAANITALAAAHAVLTVPAGVAGYATGEVVEAELFDHAIVPNVTARAPASRLRA